MDFHTFLNDFLAKHHPKTFRQSVRSFCTGLRLPRPLPTQVALNFDPQSISKKKQKRILKKNIYIITKINFLAYLKVWDHSQIVDLIFLIWVVSTRAPETHWAPHWRQNNVPKKRWPRIFSDNHGFGYPGVLAPSKLNQKPELDWN